MIKNKFKITNRLALILLAIMMSGLLNICLFAFQAKTTPIESLKFDFAYGNDGDCVAEPLPESRQAINRPAAPMPECCLAQNRNFNAVVNTANNEPTPTFTGLIISQSDASNFKNYSTHYSPRLTYPPPMALALASTIIRE